MTPITDDEHVDELKERRRARESRPKPNCATPAGIQSAGPARDLLGGLIPSGLPVGDEDRSGILDGTTDLAPAPAREVTSGSDPDGERVEATAGAGGEKIDELNRRVKEGAPAECRRCDDDPAPSAEGHSGPVPRRGASPGAQTHPADHAVAAAEDAEDSLPRDRGNHCRRRDRRPSGHSQRGSGSSAQPPARSSRPA